VSPGLLQRMRIRRTTLFLRILFIIKIRQKTIRRMFMNCSNCQKPLQHDHKFCPYCGTPARLSCAACGREIEAEWMSCPHCGINLKKPVSQSHVNSHAQVSHSNHEHGHYGGHYSNSSSGKHRKKGLLERFFS
jgi:predicted amidophosphoribosyltransferase